MNYYIQGSPARAEEIKAAFEKLGYDTTDWKFNVEGGFYYTHNDGRINLTFDKFLINTFKTHPDYKELELPVEPKFKDGDVLVTTKIRSCPFIYRKTDNNDNLAYYYVGIDGNGKLSIGWPKNTLYHFGLVTDAVIAGQEQRDALFAKMKEAGYQWDEKKKELLSAVPKFNVGDWLAGIDDEGDMATEKIVSFSHNKVLLVDTDGCHTEYPKTELNGFRLWTIADAKDGDVLVTTKIRSCPFIYRKLYFNNDLAYYYAGIDGNGNFCEGCLNRTLYHFGPVANVAPATKEQRDLLFAKMKEAGYKWDAEKKELRKIKPHYDISNFKPFDKVLVRNVCEKWGCEIFSHYEKAKMYPFITCASAYKQCIPFEGNEHLLGTTDMCPEEYINW